MEIFKRPFGRGWKHLHGRVVELLEKTEPPDSDEPVQFEPSRNPSLIRDLSVGLPQDETDRAIVVFTRLAHLFDAGLLLENEGALWSACAFFESGQAHPLAEKDGRPLRLPSVRPLEALRTPSAPLIEKLALREYLPQAPTDSFLLTPTPAFSYVLMCDWPDLWRREHIESINRALADCFSP